MHYIVRTGWTTCVCAALYGGIKGMVNEHKDFIRRNVASTFESQHLAKVI